MASKKAKKHIKEHLKIKKPVKQVKKAADEAARIKKNEQSKLYRQRKKFEGTKKKGEADKLRKQIKAQERVVSSLGASVSELREKARKITALKKEIGGLRVKNAHKQKFLTGKLKRHQADKEYHTAHNEFVKNKSLIQRKIDEIAALTYETNKVLGYDPEEIVDAIEISDGVLRTRFSKDFDENYFDEKDQEKEIERKAREQEALDGNTQDDDNWRHDLTDVFWKVWADFQKNEMNDLGQYEKVIFIFGGDEYSYVGSQPSLIILRASRMWDYAQDIGSDTQVLKEKSTGENIKLRYTVLE